MSVREAQERISSIRNKLREIERITSIQVRSGFSVRISGYDRNGTGCGSVEFSDGELSGLVFDTISNAKSELEKELEPLEQLMAAADLMFKNGGQK